MVGQNFLLENLQALFILDSRVIVTSLLLQEVSQLLQNRSYLPAARPPPGYIESAQVVLLSLSLVAQLDECTGALAQVPDQLFTRELIRLHALAECRTSGLLFIESGTAPDNP